MSLTLDARRTALVMIDLQKGIVAMPLAPYAADAVVAKSVSLAKKLAAAGGVVVRVHVDFGPGGVEKPQGLADAAMGGAGAPPVDWSDFVPSVAALPALTVVKRNWGAFHGTALDTMLRRRGIDTVIVTGIATNFGVESTAREAWQCNYSVVIAEDACTSMSAEMHGFSMEKIMPRLARVRSTAEVVAGLG